MIISVLCSLCLHFNVGIPDSWYLMAAEHDSRRPRVDYRGLIVKLDRIPEFIKSLYSINDKVTIARLNYRREHRSSIALERNMKRGNR